MLVIDDSAIALELAVQALRLAGFDAAAAPDLSSLDERLAEGTYDVVLVDVNMPEMYGDDVVEFLRVQRQLSSKLILYSGLPEEELERKCQAAGADGYIAKSRGVEATILEVARLTGFRPQLTQPLPRGELTPGPEKSRKKRVLIVDDSDVTSKLLEAELSSKGFEVATADSADKATKIILKKQTRPDLVLLDVRMPNVNGEQFCRFIKGNSLFAGIKVLLCSGEDIEELRRICREAGADGFVTKDAVLAKVLVRELGGH